jgi:hypothetical protein
MMGKNIRLIVVLLLILVVGVAGYMVYKHKNVQEQVPQTPVFGEGELKDGYIPHMPVEDRERLAKQKMDATIFTSSADAAGYVKNGLDVSYNISNVPQNKFPFYFTLSIDGKEYYRSPLIPPGKRMDSFKLKEPLKPGTYRASVMLNVLDENNNPVGARELIIKLVSE